MVKRQASAHAAPAPPGSPPGATTGSAVPHPDPDTPVLSAHPLRADVDPAVLSRFGETRWRLSDGIFEPHEREHSVNFLRFPAPFREAARSYLWVLLNVEPPPEWIGPGRRAGRPAPASLNDCSSHLLRLLRWLAAQTGHARLCDVTAADLDAYLAHVRGLTTLTMGTRRGAISEVLRLCAYHDLLPPAHRLPAPSWQHRSLDVLVGPDVRSYANRTAPLAPVVAATLLQWALRFVTDVSGDILAAVAEWQELTASRHRRPKHRPGELTTALAALLARYAAARPLPGQGAGQGVNKGFLAKELGCDRTALNVSINDRLIGAAAAACGVAEGSYLWYRPVASIDPAGPAWLPHISYDDVPRLRRLLSTACMIVIAYLSGMRPGELLSLERGCCTPPDAEADAVAPRWRVWGRQWKGARDAAGGKQPAGERRAQPWIVLDVVGRAIGLLEQLTAGSDSTLLFTLRLPGPNRHVSTRRRQRDAALTGAGAAYRLGEFVAWVNAYCAQHGRPAETIPTDPAGAVTLARFRRTLAWHIRRHPDGEIALGLQYGHAFSVMSEGYAGSADAGFIAECEWEHLLALVDDLGRDARLRAAHEQVSGPAAARYQEGLALFQARYAGRLLDAKTGRSLLRNPQLQIYHHPFLTCCFNPDTALCVVERPPSGRHTPDRDNCQARCPNIARTDRDSEEIKREIQQHLDEAGDDLCPIPLRDRHRAIAAQLQRIVDDHERRRS